MKLTKLDKQYLKDLGVSEGDFSQIERAMLKTKTAYEYNNQKISRDEAIEILGREIYLSGIARSAFHWSASRQDLSGNKTVLFDSSKLFQ